MEAMLGEYHVEDLAIIVQRLPGRPESAVVRPRAEAVDLARISENQEAVASMGNRAGKGMVWVFALVGQATNCTPLDLERFAIAYEKLVSSL